MRPRLTPAIALLMLTAAPASAQVLCNECLLNTTCETNQLYRGADIGINVDGALLLDPAAHGEAVRVVLIERGLANLDHEDLCNNVELQPGLDVPTSCQEPPSCAHATSALGILAAKDNFFGCTGLVPEAELYFSTTTTAAEQDYVDAMNFWIDTFGLEPGDVIVLEPPAGMPFDAVGVGSPLGSDVYLAIERATQAGVTVVLPAGNSNFDLDSPQFTTYRNFGDNGKILVGAGTPDTDHARRGDSAYGSLVTLQGWGYCVHTLGPDHCGYNPGGFQATSAATPIVGGACASVQSLAIANFAQALHPIRLRELLVATGTPQGVETGAAPPFPCSEGGVDTGDIGPLPNVAAAAAALGIGGPPTADCDGDGTSDWIDPGDDCNFNGVPDLCDVAAGTSDDCDGDGVPDECEVVIVETTGQLTEVGRGIEVLILEQPRRTDGDVVLSFDAVADLALPTQSFDVTINTVPVGTIFEIASSCPSKADHAEIVIDAATWNAVLEAGLRMNIRMALSSPGSMDPMACGGTPWMSASVSYRPLNADDVNANGAVDFCECISDLDGDGTVGFSDLTALTQRWGPCPLNSSTWCVADFDGNGDVGWPDLVTLLSRWGACP